VYKQIAVIFDESPEAGRALKATLAIAVGLESHVLVLTAVKPPAIYTAYAGSAGPDVAHLLEEDHLRIYEDLQDQAASAVSAAGLTSTKHLVSADGVNEIVELLRTENADLLVLGLHRKTSTISRLWNKVFELAQDSPCSVLGVH